MNTRAKTPNEWSLYYTALEYTQRQSSIISLYWMHGNVGLYRSTEYNLLDISIQTSVACIDEDLRPRDCVYSL